MKPFSARLAAFFARADVQLAAYLLLTAAVTLQQYFLPLKSFENGPAVYTEYNNYVIFKRSFFHLLEGRNLYAAFPAEQWDLFKYSPTFALFMGLLAALPDWLGLFCWNLLNSLLLLTGLRHLTGLTPRARQALGWFVLLELVTSLQNSQSNGLILGLLVWAFVFLERRNLAAATLLVLLSAFVKIFGAVAFLLFLLYPRQGRAFGYGVLWTVALVALPLLVVSAPDLAAQYQNWLALLRSDHSASAGLSMMGWLNSWFGLHPNKTALVAVGLVLLVLPLLRRELHDSYRYRLWMLASMLIWMVIFNHRAESPTFIIAMGGVGLWFFSQKSTPLNAWLVGLAFMFTSLSPTDVFPTFLRETLVYPFTLKAVFCIAVWAKLQVDLFALDYAPGRVRPVGVELNKKS